LPPRLVAHGRSGISRISSTRRRNPPDGNRAPTASVSLMALPNRDLVNEELVTEYLLRAKRDVDAVVKEVREKRLAVHQRILEILRSTDAKELLMQFALGYLATADPVERSEDDDRFPACVEYLALQVLGSSPQDLDWDPMTMSTLLAEMDHRI